MNKVSLQRLFKPKYYSLFPFFEMITGNLISAAEQLKLLMNTVDSDEQFMIIKRINETEKIGNRITSEIYSFLSGLFVLPFDREDINNLVKKIDDFLDLINEISRMVRLYNPIQIVPAYREMAEVIFEASVEIGKSLEHLRDLKNSKSQILKKCRNLDQLEKNADEVHYSGLSNLFNASENATQLTKKKKILERFMVCMEETTEVAKAIRGIVIKAY